MTETILALLVAIRVVETKAVPNARLIAAAPRTYKASYDLLVKLRALHVDCAEVWELQDALAAATLTACVTY